MFTLLMYRKAFVNSPKLILSACLHFKYEQNMQYLFFIFVNKRFCGTYKNKIELKLTSNFFLKVTAVFALVLPDI